jgi:D-glycero-D-manno-heptose 1,7-bisphosphate phosphatase
MLFVMKAIFLDRDDTVIIDKPYQSDPEGIEYFDDTKEALGVMQEKGFELFLVTNQSGIGRGMFKASDAHAVHERIQEDLKSWGLKPFRDIILCPHTPDDGCDCRKPSPKMILELIKRHNIDPAQSYMVGDKPSDAMAGKKAGVQGILLHSKDTEFTHFPSLLDFTKALP